MMSHASELDRLIREQRRDDLEDRNPLWRSERLRRSPEVLECDLGRLGEDQSRALDREIDPRSHHHAEDARRANTYHLVGLSLSWTAAVVAYDPRQGCPCPACRDVPGRWDVCLVCSRSGGDDHASPMRNVAIEARSDRVIELAGGLESLRRQESAAVRPLPLAIVGAMLTRIDQQAAAHRRPSAKPKKAAPGVRPIASRPKPKVSGGLEPARGVEVRLIRDYRGQPAGSVLRVRPSLAETYVLLGVARRET